MSAQLITALQDCVSVMERELNGLAVIQPELMQAREALASVMTKSADYDGTGIPPAGTVCEIAASTEYLKVGYPEGTKVKVYATFTDDRGVELAAFVDMLGKVGGVAVDKCFRPIRPIRTPAQIEAEERLLAAMDLHQAIHPGALWDMVASSVQARYLAAIDAGYGKTKGGAQ